MSRLEWSVQINDQFIFMHSNLWHKRSPTNLISDILKRQQKFSIRGVIFCLCQHRCKYYWKGKSEVLNFICFKILSETEQFITMPKVNKGNYCDTKNSRREKNYFLSWRHKFIFNEVNIHAWKESRGNIVTFVMRELKKSHRFCEKIWGSSIVMRRKFMGVQFIVGWLSHGSRKSRKIFLVWWHL